MYRASESDDTFAYLSFDQAVLAFEDDIECQSFCFLLGKEAGFIDPTVRKMKLSALEEHCESLHGGVMAVRPIAKRRTEEEDEEEEDTKVVLTGARVIEVHLPGIPSSPTCVGEGVDRGTDRGVQMELMNRLYRMSPSSSTLSDSYFCGDGVDLGNGGGSWE